jgi:hypothetical protein
MEAAARIELDRADPVYAPGELVTGRVCLEPGENVQETITVAWEWRARAGGVSESGPRETILLERPPNAAGGPRDYPFSFRAPSAPLSYRGRLINLEWRVLATSDSGRRPLAESTFTLVPAESATRSDYEWEHNRERTHQPRSWSHPATPPLVWFIGVLGALFMATGGLLVARAVLGASAETVQQLIVGAIVLAVGVLGAWQVFAARRARQTTAAISLAVATPIVRANETLRVSLEVPSRSGRITGARLVLVCEEEVVAPGKDREATRRNNVREIEIARSDAPAAPGQPFRLQAAVRVPPNSPLSFHGRSVSVSWLVEARLTLPFAPDFRTRAGFIVRP